MRFSRDLVLATIEMKIGIFEREFGFQPGWGWAKVEGKDVPTIVAFGRYEALLDLREEFEK